MLLQLQAWRRRVNAEDDAAGADDSLGLTLSGVVR